MPIFERDKGTIKRSRSIRNFLRRGKKTSSNVKMESFGTVIHNLKTVFITHQDDIFSWINANDIELLKQVHIACFEGRALKDMPRQQAERRNALAGLNAIIQSYKDVVTDEQFKETLKNKPYDKLEIFVSLQLIAIAEYDKLKKTKATDDNQYLAAIEVIKTLVSPLFTNALNEILPKHIELKRASSRKDLKAMPHDFDFISEGEITLPPRSEDPEYMALMNLAGVLNTSELELLVRLSKQSAMRTRNHDDLLFNFSSANQDFNKKHLKDTLLGNIAASVTRLSEHTLERTNASKTGQYDDSELKKEHDSSKVRIYKDVFKTVTTGSEIKIVSKDKSFEFLKIKLEEDAEHFVNNASLNVSGNANQLLATQAVLIDQLREMAIRLGAVSVTITSRNADNSVNVDNVLKGAFNALHANLVPKFDSETWDAIENFVANKFVASANNDDSNAYTGRYQSKQFVDFLHSIKPDKAKAIIYNDVYNQFTDLMTTLNYKPVYTANRSRPTH